ncbi:MAG: hypothetical protein RLZZ450_4259, partial [Pseudomonadota bacterium]
PRLAVITALEASFRVVPARRWMVWELSGSDCRTPG